MDTADERGTCRTQLGESSWAGAARKLHDNPWIGLRTILRQTLRNVAHDQSTRRLIESLGARAGSSLTGLSAAPQPMGQKLHTNLIVVRLKLAKQQFEIAAYPNKVQEWRAGMCASSIPFESAELCLMLVLLLSEKDIDEVLQTDRVFVNVSQGEFAKKADLVKAFGVDDEATICLRILKEGEMQVSEKERAKQSEELFHEIATIIVEKCVDANTNRALTVAIVERAMKQLEAAEQFRVLPNKSAKQQALKVIPELTVRFPIARSKMLIRVTVTAAHIDVTKPELLTHFAQVMNEIPPQALADATPYIVVSH